MKIISRAEWGAKNASRPGGTAVSLGLRDVFMGHYSLGEELGRPDTAEWVRQIQAFHMGPQRGWADIGYNFLIDVYGNVFEGRGWNYAGAHCPGFNTRGIGVCFLGDDDPGVNDVSDAAKTSFKLLYQQAEKITPKHLQVLGHRDGKPTGCPGDELYAWLKGGMHLDAYVPPAPPPAPPSPAPRPVVKAPPFPLPHGWYFGPQSGPRESVSGYHGYRDHLRRWQMQMKARGWSLTADGLYGPQTRTVTGKFQAQKRLAVDGLIGPATWRAAWEAPVT